MKVAIIGCGDIGGYVGAKLALAGERVTFIARGANLEAVQRRGVRLILADGTEQVASNVMATRDCVAAGAHELVILAVKAHQLEAVAHDVPHLCGPETVVVTMQNGIPYWYFHHHGGEWAGIPPTGRRVEIPIVGIFEFDGDRLLCEKVYFDMATVLTQMGVLPSTSQ